MGLKSRGTQDTQVYLYMPLRHVEIYLYDNTLLAMARFYFTPVCTWIKYVHTCKNTVWSLATARRRLHLCVCHKIRTQRFPWKTTTEFGWVIWPRSLGARATTRTLTRIQCSLAFEKVSICNSDRIMVEENQACGYTQTWQSDRCSRTNTPRSRKSTSPPQFGLGEPQQWLLCGF